jgi:hypothetical protein
MSGSNRKAGGGSGSGAEQLSGAPKGIKLRIVIGVAVLLFVSFTIGVNVAMHGLLENMLERGVRKIAEEIEGAVGMLPNTPAPVSAPTTAKPKAVPIKRSEFPVATVPSTNPPAHVSTVTATATATVKPTEPSHPDPDVDDLIIGRSAFFRKAMTSSAYVSAAGEVESARRHQPAGPIAKYVNQGDKLPLIMLTSDRGTTRLPGTIENLFTVRGVTKDNIVVIQDGNNKEVEAIVNKQGFKLIQNTQGQRLRGGARMDGAQAIAAHYKFALTSAFDAVPNAPAIIIIEDDLLFSPDFYEYMHTVGPVLEQDKNTLVVSAWNDNGFLGKVNDPYQLRRTEYFPGLGWLLPRKLYKGWYLSLDKKMLYLM